MAGVRALLLLYCLLFVQCRFHPKLWAGESWEVLLLLEMVTVMVVVGRLICHQLVSFVYLLTLDHNS